MKGLSHTFISQKIIILTFIVIGLFGGVFSLSTPNVAAQASKLQTPPIVIDDPIGPVEAVMANTITAVCTDSKQQEQAKECIHANGFEGDLNSAFNTCIQDAGLNTCSVSEVSCQDETSLSSFNECVLSCNGDSACATESCSEVCPLLGYLQYKPSPTNITCTNAEEQAQVQKCITEYGLQGDINTAFEVCVNKPGLKTCSIGSPSTYKDSKSQAKYDECVLSCGGDTQCVSDKCSGICPIDQNPVDPLEEICGTLTSMPAYGVGSWPTPSGLNYCRVGIRSKLTSSVPYGTNGCTSPYGCAHWSCLDKSDKPLLGGSCTIPYTMPSANAVCGVANGGFTSTFPATANLCAVGTPLLQQTNTTVISAGGRVNSMFGPQTDILRMERQKGNFVYDIAEQNGKYIVVGPFGRNINDILYGMIARNGMIARINADGSLDEIFQENVRNGANNIIRSVQTLSDNRLLIAGYFSEYNEIKRPGLAILQEDGSLDESFELQINISDSRGATPRILHAEQQIDGRILIVGSFIITDQEGNIIRSDIARLNSDGSLDESFNNDRRLSADPFIGIGIIPIEAQPVAVAEAAMRAVVQEAALPVAEAVPAGEAIPAAIPSEAVQTKAVMAEKRIRFPSQRVGNITTTLTLPDGKILIGGTFQGFDLNNGASFARPYIARLNADGSFDTSFQPIQTADSSINDIGLYNNKLIIVGNFQTYGEFEHPFIAQLNLDGSVDNSFEPHVDGPIYGMDSDADGNILLGGAFKSIDKEERLFVGAIDAPQSVTTYTWSCAGAGTGSTVSCLSYQISNGTTCVPYSGSQYINTRLPQPSIDLPENGSGSITGIIAGNGFLRLSLTNLSNNPQTIQYAEPVRNTNNEVIGGDFYGCQSSGWDVSNPLTWPQNIQIGTNPNTAGYAFLVDPTDRERGFVTSSDIDSHFVAWNKPNRGFKASCEICIKPITTPTQTGDCKGLPANAIPNIATGITQYQYADGNRYPSIQYSYNPSISTTSCNFVCATNYTWNDSVKACIPNTQQVACQGTLPANTVTIPENTFNWTQTWNGSTQSWLPAGPYSYEYTCNPSEPDKCKQKCAFMCKENYTWDDSTKTCIPNSSGALTCPTFTIPNAVVVRADTFPTAWNGTAYVPNPPANINWQYEPNPSTAGCYYTCNANSVWYNGQCIQKVYHWETMTGACAANPATNGLCGTANGTTILAAPSFATLCFVGTPTAVAGNGPWSWSCNGLNGGTTATCSANKTSTTYAWDIGNWGICTNNSQSRTVICKDGNGNTVADSLCPQPKPSTSQSCGATTTYSREVGTWSTCSNNSQTRPVLCRSSNGSTVADSFCPQPKPATSQSATCPVVNGVCTNFPSPGGTRVVGYYSRGGCSGPDPVACESYGGRAYQPASVNNACIAGQYNDILDDDTYRKRQCVGSNGGSTVTCEAEKEYTGPLYCQSSSC